MRSFSPRINVGKLETFLNGLIRLDWSYRLDNFAATAKDTTRNTKDSMYSKIILCLSFVHDFEFKASFFVKDCLSIPHLTDFNNFGCTKSNCQL